MGDEKDWLTPDEAAQQLKIHPDTVRNFIRRKQLPATRIGTIYRIKRKDWEKFLAERSTKEDP